jgi:transposase InsO family protein
MTEALRQDGIRCNKKRVARLMRINGIVAKTKRKFKVTTHSNHRRPVTNNLIKGDFTAPAPDKIWTSDITYVWTRQGWLYLAVFLDLCSRRIVGWSMSRRITDTESFFATLKTELIYHEKYETRDDARRNIFKYIEIFYNQTRIHSALGGVSPAQFEKMRKTA